MLSVVQGACEEVIRNGTHACWRRRGSFWAGFDARHRSASLGKPCRTAVYVKLYAKRLAFDQSNRWETYLVVRSPADRFLEIGYGAAENERFQSEASLAFTPVGALGQGIDLGWTCGLALGKIRDENMAEFVEESVGGHKQESLERMMVICLGCFPECGRHMISSLIYGQLARGPM